MARDLDRLAGLRASIAAQRDDLAHSAEALALDKTRLTDLIAARQQSLDQAQSALEAERKRAAELANQALNLKDLIAQMESQIPGARAGASRAVRGSGDGRGRRLPRGGGARRRSRPAEARDRLRRRQGRACAARRGRRS